MQVLSFTLPVFHVIPDILCIIQWLPILLLIMLVFQSPFFNTRLCMHVCFFLSVSLSLSVCLILIYIILRNQATSFDGVIPSGSLPLYF